MASLPQFAWAFGHAHTTSSPLFSSTRTSFSLMPRRSSPTIQNHGEEQLPADSVKLVFSKTKSYKKAKEQTQILESKLPPCTNNGGDEADGDSSLLEVSPAMKLVMERAKEYKKKKGVQGRDSGKGQPVQSPQTESYYEMEGQAVQLSDEDQASQARKSVQFHPSVWGDYFIVNGGKASLHDQEEECRLQNMRKRAEGLKDKVKRLLKDAAAETDLLQTMSLIDSIQILGLEYHFEEEINEALARIYDTKTDNSFSLHETALRFRLLRQQGRYVSSEVFNKFLDEENKFMACLKDDVRGLLSLYHAAYLGTHDETILDQAKSFARSQLESMLSELEPSLAKQVCLALETPLYRRTRSLLARHYMRIYQDESTEPNDAILQLAKLDFNLLQSLYREELHNICTWWKDLDAPKHLCFARDRVVECYFSMMQVHPEPRYSLARLATTKLACLFSILDDIYDVYSTLEEAQLLTDAIQRWDATCIEHLPEYMKYFYLKLTSFVEELEIALAPQDKYRISYLKKSIEDLSRSFFEESKWAAINYVPCVEEHLRVSLISSVHPIECASFVGMGDIVTKEKLEWVRSFPPIVKATSLIARVMNDIRSREFEQSNEHVASTVRCYMKEHQTDMNVACEKLRCLVEDAWKDINEECLKTPFPKVLLETMVNYARVADTLYKHSDEYTNSTDSMRENISLLFVDPITL